MTISALLLATLLASERSIPALGNGAAMLSPDHQFYAMTVHGEADCQFLFIIKVDPRRTGVKTLAKLRKGAEGHAMDSDRVPMPPGSLLERMDAESFLWLPHKPHKLVFSESNIYGKGIIAVWDGGTKYRAIDDPKTPEAVLRLVSYVPRTHRLNYTVETTDHQVIRRTRRNITVR
jgi:hypothetical protein